MGDQPLDINALANAARAQAALRRSARADKKERIIGGDAAPASPKAEPSIAKRYAARQAGIELAFADRPRDDAPAQPPEGEPLECVRTEHRLRYTLGGRTVEVGEHLEVFTNAHTG